MGHPHIVTYHFVADTWILVYFSGYSCLGNLHHFLCGCPVIMIIYVPLMHLKCVKFPERHFEIKHHTDLDMFFHLRSVSVQEDTCSRNFQWCYSRELHSLHWSPHIHSHLTGEKYDKALMKCLFLAFILLIIIYM